MIVSLRKDSLKVGEWYIAYSAKSKMLSSNGKRGMYVQVLGLKLKSADVYIPRLDKKMTLGNIDQRKDMWIVPANFEHQVQLTHEATADWPRYFDKMTGQLGNVDSVSVMERDEDIPYLRIECEDKTRMARVGWVTIKSDFYKDVIYQDEVEEAKRKEEEKLRAEAAERIAKRQEEAVKLMRGKMDDGSVKLLAWALPVRDKMLKERGERRNVVSSFSRAFFKKKMEIGTLHADRAILNGSYATACHASMNSNQTEGKYCGLIWTDHNNIQDNIVCRDGQIAWIDYIINRSGLAKAHLVKDAEDVFENGYLLRSDFPSRFIHAATSGTRQLWEVTAKGHAFWELVVNGCNEHFAWYAAQFASGSEGNLKLNNRSSSHSFMCQGEMGDKALLNFLRGTPKVKYKDYVDEQRYQGCNAQWGSRGECSFHSDIVAKCGAKKATGEGFGRKETTFTGLELAGIVQEIGEKWCAKMNIDPITLEDL